MNNNVERKNEIDEIKNFKLLQEQINKITEIIFAEKENYFQTLSDKYKIAEKNTQYIALLNEKDEIQNKHPNISEFDRVNEFNENYISIKRLQEISNLTRQLREQKYEFEKIINELENKINKKAIYLVKEIEIKDLSAILNPKHTTEAQKVYKNINVLLKYIEHAIKPMFDLLPVNYEMLDGLLQNSNTSKVGIAMIKNIKHSMEKITLIKPFWNENRSAMFYNEVACNYSFLALLLCINTWQRVKADKESDGNILFSMEKDLKRQECHVKYTLEIALHILLAVDYSNLKVIK